MAKEAGKQILYMTNCCWKRDQNVDDRKLGYTILAQKNHGKNLAVGAAKRINSSNDCEEEVLCSKSHHKKGLANDPMLKHATATKALSSSQEQNRPQNKNQEGKAITKLKSKAGHVHSTSPQKLYTDTLFSNCMLGLPGQHPKGSQKNELDCPSLVTQEY